MVFTATCKSNYHTNMTTPENCIITVFHLMYVCIYILYNVNWYPDHPIKTRSAFLSVRIVFKYLNVDYMNHGYCHCGMGGRAG